MHQVINMDAAALPKFEPRNLDRYPRLDTVLMVEEALYKYKSEKTLNWIWKNLPKSVMWTTFTTIVDYLEHSGKIKVEKDRTVTWIWDPEGVKKILENKKLLAIAGQSSGDSLMKRIDIIAAIREKLRASGVKKAYLFGSFARGEKVYRDIDLAIEPPKGFSLLDLVGLEQEIGDKVGKRADVSVLRSIKPALLPYIRKDLTAIL